MNKLYWIICEERDKTLFEGRCQARTRGAALKYLKEQLGRSNLTGLVFTITEIPVPLIREIVKAVMENRPLEDVTIVGGEPVTTTEPDPEKPVRFDAFQSKNIRPLDDKEEAEDTPPPPRMDRKPRTQPEYPWEEIKAFYMETGSPKQTAEKFGVKLGTIQGRIQREGWAKERRAS